MSLQTHPGGGGGRGQAGGGGRGWGGGGGSSGGGTGAGGPPPGPGGRPDPSTPPSGPPGGTARPVQPAPSAGNRGPAVASTRPTSVDSGDAAATIALTLLTLAAVISLGRLFSTSNWIAPVVTMALGMHAVSWLARRQRWSPATSALAIAAAFVLLASWLVLASSTRFGLPLSGTWHAVGQAVRDARSDYNGAVAPTPATHGLIFVTTVAVGGLAVLADWAAFRMRATIEATVPSLTLFVFTSYLRGRQDRSQIIALELAALVAFIVVHQSTVGRDRSAWFANRPTGALSSAFKTGGVIGIVAIVICLNLAFRLPGAGARAVLKLRPGDHGARIAPDPLVDVRSRLLDHSGVPLFTVQSSTASYWRLTSLDTYSGTEWTANDSYAPVHTTLPKDGATTKGVKVEQDFTIDQLDSPWLPAAYQPESISGADVKSGISYDPQSGSLITSQNTSSGLKYHVTSTLNVGQLSPTLLESAPAVSPNDRSLARYVKLPHIDDRVTALAQAITTGKKTEYDKALALQNYLPRPRQLHLRRHLRPKGDGIQRPQLLPLHLQAGVLPAVRRILRGHGPGARPADPPGSRLDLRQADRWYVDGHRRRVPHLA